MALIYLGYKALKGKKGEKEEGEEQAPDIRDDIPKDPNEKKKKVRFALNFTQEKWTDKQEGMELTCEYSGWRSSWWSSDRNCDLPGHWNCDWRGSGIFRRNESFAKSSERCAEEEAAIAGASLSAKIIFFVVFAKELLFQQQHQKSHPSSRRKKATTSSRKTGKTSC